MGSAEVRTLSEIIDAAKERIFMDPAIFTEYWNWEPTAEFRLQVLRTTLDTLRVNASLTNKAITNDQITSMYVHMVGLLGLRKLDKE